MILDCVVRSPECFLICSYCLLSVYLFFKTFASYSFCLFEEAFCYSIMTFVLDQRKTCNRKVSSLDQDLDVRITDSVVDNSNDKRT